MNVQGRELHPGTLAAIRLAALADLDLLTEPGMPSPSAPVLGRCWHVSRWDLPLDARLDLHRVGVHAGWRAYTAALGLCSESPRTLLVGGGR